MVTIDEEKHEYTLEGRRIDGVTETLGAVFREYDGVPSDDLVRRRDLGLAVHRACELDDLGQIGRYEIPPAIEPYLEAWRACKRELRITVVKTEQIVYSRLYVFAGRIDVLAHVGREVTVTPIDRKVVRRVSPVTRLQVTGYEIAARETWPDFLFSGEGFAVQLQENGRPKIDGPYITRQHRAAFLGVLAAARFMKEHGLR